LAPFVYSLKIAHGAGSTFGHPLGKPCRIAVFGGVRKSDQSGLGESNL
jgi:hypothetical protein